MTLLLAVFAAGVAIGGPAWNAFSDERPYDRDTRGGTSDSRGRRHTSYSDHLQEELILTTEQRTAIDSILEGRQEEMHDVWSEMRARIDTLRQHISSQIMEVLDDDQQEHYREMIASSNRRGDRERAPKNDRNQ